jgi:hypothetical protein
MDLAQRDLLTIDLERVKKSHERDNRPGPLVPADAGIRTLASNRGLVNFGQGGIPASRGLAAHPARRRHLSELKMGLPGQSVASPRSTAGARSGAQARPESVVKTLRSK